MRLAFNGSYRISNPFGVYDPSAYARYPGMKHPGTDFVRPVDTPIVAGMTGRVSTVPSTGKTGRGNEVIITNGNKQRKACHLNRIDVKNGEWIEEGQQIGLLGYTGYVVDSQGRVGTRQGAHLHDELLIDGKYVDLMKHLEGEDMKMTVGEMDSLKFLATRQKVTKPEIDKYQNNLAEYIQYLTRVQAEHNVAPMAVDQTAQAQLEKVKKALGV